MKKKLVVLISPTAFKGTLSPQEAASLIAQTIKKKEPHWKGVSFPLADGGNGTLQVLSKAFKARKMKTRVKGPLGKPVWASWSYISEPIVPSQQRSPGPVAIIEMAQASGLALLKEKNRIREATTEGTGELIRAALDKGAQTIFIGMGGTATADGGAGALAALGLRYFDERENQLSPQPKDLIRMARVDWHRFDKRLARTKITILCDVINPLLGPKGSAKVFGPQKGALPSDVRFLEGFLRKWSTFAPRQRKNHPGAGAAGALAYGLSAFSGARLVPGAPFILKKLNWSKQQQKADLIVTGEGNVDRTSFSGKVIGSLLKETRKPVYVLCGSTSLKPGQLKRFGIKGWVSLGSAGLKAPRRSLKKATAEWIKSFGKFL